MNLHLLSTAALAITLAALPAPARAQEHPFIPTDDNSWAFNTKGDPSAPSPIDLRSLNETLAGQTGFVHRSPDGRTLLRGDGQPMRFWATHANVQPKWSDEQATTYARSLARLGVNLIRCGALITPQPGQPDIFKPNPEELTKVWRTVATLRKQGVYSMVSPIWLHEGFEQDPGIEGYGPKQPLFGVIFVEPRLQAAYKSWVKALYTTPNPYTGVALKDDPAVIAIEIFNEDTLLFYTFQNIKGGPKRKLQEQFAVWATKQYGSLDKAMAAWNGVKVDGDDPGTGQLGFMTWWYATSDGAGKNPSPKRFGDQLRFVAQLQRSFHEEMLRYLRDELGCKQLLTTSNFHAADKSIEDLENWTKAAGDIVCANTYVNVNHVGKNTGWRIDPGDFITSDSCTRNPLVLPMLKKQLAGYPYWVTETLWPHPQEYQNEGPLLTAIYTGVTGVNAVFFAGPRDVTWGDFFYFPWVPENRNGYPFFKFNCSDPGSMSSFPAAALIHRMGYVKTPEPSVIERRTFDDMTSLKLPILAEGGEYDPNRYTGGGMAGAKPAALPQEAFLTGPVLIDTNPDAKQRTPDPATLAARVTRSTTGQVTADPQRGIVTLDTPEAQAVVGFLKSAGPIALQTTTIAADVEHAGIAIVSLDGKPITQASKVLVEVAPRVRPTGWRLESATHTPAPNTPPISGWKILNTGHLPFRVETVPGTITFKGTQFTKATRLDENGLPAGQADLHPTGPDTTLPLPQGALFVLLER